MVTISGDHGRTKTRERPVEETSFPTLRWHDRRVFAVDGTKICLQRSSDLEDAFGVPDGAHCPLALLSVLFDVCAKVPVDLQISSFASSEREHLCEMLHCLEPGDVLVLDRGYPSHEVIQTLSTEGIDFLIRVPASNTFTIIDDFRATDSKDKMFRLNPPQGSPPEWKPIPLRVVRVEGPDGKESFFVTSLRRPEFTLSQLRDLYHMRWEAEEFYKLLKSPYIGQGQFRSKSRAGVEQEIHALVLFLAIARVLMVTAAVEEGVDPKHLSKKSAVLGLASYITRIFLCDNEGAARSNILDLFKRITRVREKPRPGRSFPRVSFRPRLRWGATGRCGG